MGPAVLVAARRPEGRGAPVTGLCPPTPPSSAPAGAPAFRSLLHVNEKGGRFGGTEEYLAVLGAELGRRQVTSHLVCGSHGSDLPDDGLASTHLLDGLARREGAPGTAEALAGLVRRLGPEVVYLHNVFDARLVEALDELRPRPVLLWYVHDHYVTCLTELRLRREGACTSLLGQACLGAVAAGECVRRHEERDFGLAELAAREALLGAAGRADAVVVVSRYMRDLLQAHLAASADRVHLLPRPIRLGPSAARPGARGVGARGGSGRGRVVAFAGRITPEKGLDVVLEALGSMVGTGPVELRIAGVVEHEAHWERCCALARAAQAANHDLQVRYLGHLSYAEADDLFALADVVVVPSRWPEPLGAVVGEALARGAAVAASRVGGLDTFVEHEQSGLLVEPGDVAAWAAALHRLLTDRPLARRLAEQGAQLAARHSIEAHVDALDDLVRRIGRLG
ncbi:MAG: glycosyltransferase [Acidimicrobiia bacterium]|nr:glycosyltransferase [Acidimicrobiia bacterium]